MKIIKKIVKYLPAITSRIGKISPKMEFYCNKIRHKIVTNLIYNDIKDTVQIEYIKEHTIDDKYQINPSTPIYYLWWQGEESMPPLILSCFNSLRKVASEHPVKLISKKNILEVISNKEVSVPFDIDILQWLEKEVISIQYFSDILRSWLLFNFGGVWVDATILFPGIAIDDIIQHRSFYTRVLLKEQYRNDYVSHNRWSGYFWASYPDYPLFLFLYNGLREIIKKNGYIYEYFTIDYLIDIFYKKNKEFRILLQEIQPVARPHELDNLNAPIDNSIIQKIKCTGFYKLSHKNICREYDDQNHPTYYNYIINSKL